MLHPRQHDGNRRTRPWPTSSQATVPPPAIPFYAPGPGATTTRCWTISNGTIGQVAVASIKRPQVIAQMEANAHRTRFANYIQQVLSVLFEHAIDLGLARPQPRQIRAQTQDACGAARTASSLDRRGHRDLPGACASNRPADLRAWHRQRAAPWRLAEVPLVRLRRRGAPHHARQNRGQPLAALFARPQAHA
jgi:hypothetical protein